MDPMTRLRTILVPVMGFLPAACGTVEPEPFPELVVTTEALPAATRGSAYAEAIHAAGGDGAYSWAGTLPPGLVIMTGDLGADDAVVTGMPEAEGTFMFTVTVTSGDGQTASAGLSIQVLPEVPISIGRLFVPPALAGASYDVALGAQGGDGQTFQWSVAQGPLPAGNPRFTGSHAIQAYQAIGGDGDVPVENQGGEGTRDAHWRQSVLGNERMTGFSAAPGVPQPLSVVSLASFRDLGYAVDLDAADSFALAAHGELNWESLGHDEILREPVRVLKPVLREP
jgi:hypothetical protein